ncbi:YciI family protein [Streptomyces sp. NPDC005805]|uniref:YciI family protein n=1 Tax=Streptomyces sp. NPDC005805 TaxID=3157068 RepID=UPI0033D2AA87
MKYLVMIQGTQADADAMGGKPSPGAPAWSEEEVQAMFSFMGSLNNDLAESGELVEGQGLAEPRQARHVLSGRDGRPVVTDGPYGETKEVLAGYWVLDCESLERVTEIAARITRCPVPAGTTEYPVVIRQIMGGPDQDCDPSGGSRG